MEDVLEWLRAAGEQTRLRILHVLSRSDLTVTEITQVLGQSQPRVSRHLKLLCDSGLIERIPEGTWAFYRLPHHGRKLSESSDEQARAVRFTHMLTELIDADSPILVRDNERLAEIKQARARKAAEYFEANASDWDRIRKLHLPEADVEQALIQLVGPEALEHRIDDLIDLGTGTGRVLELLSNRITRGIGIDSNREMLALARANLEKQDLSNCYVRQGDIFALPFTDPCANLVVIHQVLHFLAEPRSAVLEAARLLHDDGILIIVDFKSHHLDYLRDDYAHNRLGFDDSEIQAWCTQAGLTIEETVELPPLDGNTYQKLTVGLWKARRAGGLSKRRVSKALKMEAAQ